MKTILSLLLIAIFPGYSFSQTKVSKTYPLGSARKIELKFDYPKIVHVSSWDKKEISVEASVKINDGQNDQAFTLQETTADGTISISNKIDMSQIPDAYYVMIDGIKTRFNSKQDFENYRNEKSGTHNRISSYQQKDIVVTVEVKLPAGISTDVVSVYGMIELADMDGPVKVTATYGGIDASLNTSKIGQIKLTNRFGNIYSNLELKPTAQKQENFYTSITASPGKGPSYEINSSYGNIYLRKGTER